MSEFKITLAPGPLEWPIVRQLVERAAGASGWLHATAYGDGEPDEIPLGPRDDVLAEIEPVFRASGKVDLAAGNSSYLLIRPDRRALSLFGAIHGVGDPKKLTAERIADLVAIVNTPLAYQATSEALNAFARRWVVEPDGSEEMKLTVGGYHRGLEHPHWRMWLGKEWTNFLGRDALAQAPAVESRPQGDGWFVQVLDRPEDWNKPAGIQAAEKFGTALGRNVFFDPAAPDRPLEAPDFSPLMAAARAMYPSLKEFVPQNAP